jgi:hypothetical protein
MRFALIAATAFAALALLCASRATALTVFVGVAKSAASYAATAQRENFARSVLSALATMMGAPATEMAPTTALGSLAVVDVAEVNDTFTNMQLSTSLDNTGHAIIEAAAVASWNAVKSTGIAIASTQGPSAETQGARTVVFVAIVTIVAVVCAGLASWFVRRRAVEKHRGISFQDLAGIEEELYRRREDQSRQGAPSTPSATAAGTPGGAARGGGGAGGGGRAAPQPAMPPPATAARGNFGGGPAPPRGGGRR